MTNRFPLMLAAVLAVMILTACGATKHIAFTEHAPYHSPVTYGAPLLIVLPDEFAEEKYVYSVPVGPVKDKYSISYGQAFKIETAAQFQRMFSQIALINSAMYDQVLIVMDEDSPTTSSELNPMDYPSFITEDAGYLLVIDAFDFKFDSDRAVCTFNALLKDRFTEAILLEGRMTGRSESTKGKPNERIVSQMTVMASKLALNNLSRVIRDAMEDNKR